MLALRALFRWRSSSPFPSNMEPWLRAKGDGKKPKGAGKGKEKAKEEKPAAGAAGKAAPEAEGKKPAAKPGEPAKAGEKKPPPKPGEEEEEVFVEKKKKIELPVFYKGGQKTTAQQASAENPREKSEKRMKKFRLSFNPKRKRKGADTVIPGLDVNPPGGVYPEWIMNAVQLFSKKMRWQDMSLRDPKYWKLKRREEIKERNRSLVKED